MLLYYNWIIIHEINNVLGIIQFRFANKERRNTHTK